MSYKGNQQRKKHLKRLAKETAHSYCSGAYYDEDKDCYVKYSAHSPWLKTYSRRITRRRMKQIEDIEQLPSGKSCKYKRYHDYWWELF